MPLFDLSFDRCYNCGRPMDPATGQQFCSQTCETNYLVERGPDMEYDADDLNAKPCRNCGRPADGSFCGDRCAEEYERQAEALSDARDDRDHPLMDDDEGEDIEL